ncbi:MAG: aminopeptidase [Candidatus Eremiobacteraeota bacterium]|nr:aminopeptidase [Candidatus Eremiobacteraeota bacterium]
MSRVAYDKSLVPGARNAIEVCLGVTPEQPVYILTDRQTATVGSALFDAVEKIKAPVRLEVLEDHVERPADRLPDSIMKPLDDCRVCLYCVQPLPGELPSRQQFVYRIEELGIRYAHMVGITEAIMCQGMRADFRKVDEVSRRLLEKAKKASHIEVRSRCGTDVVATFSPDRIWRKTSGIIEEVWSNLPGGEIFTAPMSVDGVFVVDGSVGDHFSAKYGVLDKTPMTLELEGGYLKKVSCANKALEREFWDYCHKAVGSDRVGEFAIGTNLAVFEFTGNLLQDEKMPGVHIAFGDPYGSQTGADWSCPTHVDVITGTCDVWIDGFQVMEHGIFLADQLDFDYAYLAEDPSVAVSTNGR